MPAVLAYWQPSLKRRRRLRIALILTIIAGIAAGLAIFYGWCPGLDGMVGYSFGCTLVMGLLAGRRQAAIALAASTTVSGTIAGLELLTEGRGHPGFIFSEALPIWLGLFILSAICAALATPLTMVRLRPRSER